MSKESTIHLFRRLEQLNGIGAALSRERDIDRLLENILEAPVHVQGRPRAEVMEEARALLAQVGLSDRAGHRPSQLSGGQQQRVAIARALAMRPAVLLLDEPTSALDPELREEVRDVLRRLADDGLTMLLVTHDLQLARDVSDRIRFFHGGRVMEEGRPEAVLDDPQHPRTREFRGKPAGG